MLQKDIKQIIISLISELDFYFEENGFLRRSNSLTYIRKLDGVIQFVSMICENKSRDNYGEEYSEDITMQETIAPNDPCFSDNEETIDETRKFIDLKASDYILFSEANSMHEIKNKDKDIIVITKVR